MSPDISFDGVLELEGVRGYALVSSEDGTIIKRDGITPGNVDEIVAFVGSAGEIISRECELGEMKSIKGIGIENVVITKYNNNYLGFVVEKNRKYIVNRILDKIEEETKKGDQNVYRLFNLKANQLNMLLKEFSKDTDEEMWKSYISKGLEAISREHKCEDVITLEGLELKILSSGKLTREDVNNFMKLLLDFIVKKAINEFGSDEARKRVHNVIKKVGGKKS